MNDRKRLRVGNRVNEGYAELSVVLYLPDGRVACQFGRPAITANDKFVADGLSVEIVEPLKRLTMRYDGDLMLLDDPELLRNPKLLGQAPRVPGKVVFETTGISPLHGGEPLSATQILSSGSTRTACAKDQAYRLCPISRTNFPAASNSKS